ncbi:MAG: pyrimidine/purine nucleoside phosphorylase [Campylobacterota bacterium]|nr:pyrimidine/purine nucleoside phosphorylase [Campylobacterota bacterium]
MNEFKNVEVKKSANVYFDGKVVSYSVAFEDGSVKTLGVMQIGKYEFGTDKAEIMEILSGEMEVTLPDATSSITVKGPQSFNVPASSKFQVDVKSIADYCCSYID